MESIVIDVVKKKKSVNVMILIIYLMIQLKQIK